MKGRWGCQSTPNRVACGTVSFSISSRFGVITDCMSASPVMFPPGRARLDTCPTLSGSACVAKTMGIVLVARRADSDSVEEVAKMISTFMRASSAAASCICSTVPDHRNSMTRFLPST